MDKQRGFTLIELMVVMRTLFENGCLAVEQGLTTFEELIRVLGMPHGE
ncbi:prepilin-type N-terminal cleavage/methylation domain-containing protein [Escherichia coli]